MVFCTARTRKAKCLKHHERVSKGLEGNKWIEKTYQKHDDWDKSWMRGGRKDGRKFILRLRLYTRILLGSFWDHSSGSFMASSSHSNQKSSSDPPAPDPPLTRQEQEQATQDRTLAEFLLILDEYEPLV